MQLRMRQGYSLGAAGIVLAGERVLLVRRMHEPNRGRWTFPSGYVNPIERVDEAAVREVAEETGVRAVVEAVVGMRNRVSPTDNNLLVMFLMRALAGEPAPDGVEVDGARYFTFAEALAEPDFISVNKTFLRKVTARDYSSFSPTEIPPTPGLLALDYIAFL